MNALIAAGFINLLGIIDVDLIRADSDNWPWNEMVSKALRFFEVDVAYHISYASGQSQRCTVLSG